jgi:dTDP-4-amino-4,6-dideoxygalactose transaminase
MLSEGAMSMSSNVYSSIPFLDLVAPHIELERELTEVFLQALHTAGFIGGSMVQDFEEAFAAFCGSKYSVAVSSGTDALRFAVMACGVQPGDVVVTVPHTFIATTEAISQAGAVPEFIDIDERTYNMSAEMLRRYLELECKRDSLGRLISCRSGRPVTSIIPVHIYGQIADMDSILELAARYNITVIEDACQAHGAEYFSKKTNSWKKAGSMGSAAAFSFYPGKNLGACGEGGAVTTNDADLARHMRMLRDHGQSQKYYHDVEGYNGRLDAIQAGILLVKLKALAEWNERRRENAKRYDELLNALVPQIVLPYEPSWSKAVYHLYVVRVADRARFQKDLADAHIGTGIHYPVPLHLQKAYKSLRYQPGDFPVAEHVATEIVSLPMFPQLTADQQRKIAQSITKCLQPSKVLRGPRLEFSGSASPSMESSSVAGD